jgi:hypothetical protein
MTSPATADAGFNPSLSATVRGGDCRGYPICPLGASPGCGTVGIPIAGRKGRHQLRHPSVG